MDPDLSQFKYKLPEPLSTQPLLLFVRSVLYSILQTWIMYFATFIIIRIIRFHLLLWSGWSPKHALLMIIIEALDTQPNLTDIDSTTYLDEDTKVIHYETTTEDSNSSLPQLFLEELGLDPTSEDTELTSSTNKTPGDVALNPIQAVLGQFEGESDQHLIEAFSDKSLPDKIKNNQSDRDQEDLEEEVKRKNKTIDTYLDQRQQQIISEKVPSQSCFEKESNQSTKLQPDRTQHQHKQQEIQSHKNMDRNALDMKQPSYTDKLWFASMQQKIVEKSRNNKQYKEQRQAIEEQYKRERINQIQLQLWKDGLRYEKQNQDHIKENQQFEQPKQGHSISRARADRTTMPERQKDIGISNINPMAMNTLQHVNFKHVSARDPSKTRHMSPYAAQNESYYANAGNEAVAFQNDQKQEKHVSQEQLNRLYIKEKHKGTETKSNYTAREHIQAPSASNQDNETMYLDSQTEDEGSELIGHTDISGETPPTDFIKLKQAFNQEVFKDDHEKADKINAALTFASLNKLR